MKLALLYTYQRIILNQFQSEDLNTGRKGDIKLTQCQKEKTSFIASLISFKMNSRKRSNKLKKS